MRIGSLSACTLAFAAFLAAMLPMSARAEPVSGGHAMVDLISERSTIAPGDKFMAALKLDLDEGGWHVYWKNPGDSGLPPVINWTLPEGVETGPFTWPTPHVLEVGGLVNYGYEHEVTLPFEVTVPPTYKPGDTLTLSGQATYLICLETCIPEAAPVSLSLPVGPAPVPSDTGSKAIGDTLAHAPQPIAGEASVERTPKGFRVSVLDPELSAALKDGASAHFYPDGQEILHATPQVFRYGDAGVSVELESSEYAAEGDQPLSGAFAVDTGDGVKAWLIQATPGATPVGVTDHAFGAGGASAASVGAVGVALLLLGAFAGGLVLNLMPCVLPVLSIKAAGLVQHAHDPGEARKHGVAYFVGVMVCFIALAGVLSALRLAGEQVGLGFQLQYPALVAVFALLMFAVGLNMIGVFEIGTSLQNVGGGLAQKSGTAGAFFTGLLAGFVGAPCVGPFMGPAMGFALTQPIAVVFAFFAVVGVGMAFPFLLLSFSPALARLLPKPGKWMETFRQALSFPMFLTALWLLWVLAGLAGPNAVLLTVGGAIVLAFGVWLAKRWGGGAIGRVAAALVLVLSFAAPAILSGRAGSPVSEAVASNASVGELASEPWSPARVAELRGQGRVIFVDFTARWCVTCQVNKASIHSAQAHKAFEAQDAVFLVGDWTTYDETIGAELKAHGRAGVPLYLVYPADGGDPAILPQLLTPALVAKEITAAGAVKSAQTESQTEGKDTPT